MADSYKGTLKARATKAGMSTEKFAQANIHADGPVGKLARLRYTMDSGGVHGNGKSNMASPGDKRSIGAKLYQVG